MRDAFGCAARARGLPVNYQAVMRGASKQNNPQSLIEVLGWSSRGGGLHAKKIEGADAFGFYERTPSLPYTIKEDPRFELHPHFNEAMANVNP